MNYKQLAEYYELDQRYFNIMKCMAKTKYDFIFSFSDKIKDSAKLFLNYMDELYQKIEDIFFSFKTPNKFSKWLFEKGIYNNLNMGASNISRIIFSKPDTYFSIRFSVIERLQRVVREYEEEFEASKVDKII